MIGLLGMLGLLAFGAILFQVMLGRADRD